MATAVSCPNNWGEVSVRGQGIRLPSIIYTPSQSTDLFSYYQRKATGWKFELIIALNIYNYQCLLLIVLLIVFSCSKKTDS